MVDGFMNVAVKDPFDREKQFAAKRRAVIRSAGQAFRRRGYHNTSMTQIAETLGLSKAALYYYVMNKEEVLFECHIIAYDAMDEILKDRHEEGSSLDKLEVLYTKFVTMLTSSGVSLLTDVNSLGDENKAIILMRRGKIERKIIRLVKEGQKDGSIREGDARLHVFFLMGGLNWLNAWYDSSGRLKGEKIAAHFALQMRAGIRS